MMNTVNPASHPDLDAKMSEIESEIRNNFSETGRASIRKLPAVQAYTAYYRKFKKTYHVQLQIESVALKNKSLPRISALVSAMFAAELKNQLLTAGHDMSTIQLPLVLDVANGHESYTSLNGTVQTLSLTDMFISDNKGVISSIIYGPDNRTPIKSDTSEVIFTVYGPEGISSQQMTSHLEDIRSFVYLVSPDAYTGTLEIISG
ncbi:MAG: phenylalanine--tRNA ligase beta subunit-related protein [Chloroflexota bacterium]|nr:phenylalanine--tRNA ligase beta subunit-related protein [Chloroflexota bacterium]